MQFVKPGTFDAFFKPTKRPCNEWTFEMDYVVVNILYTLSKVINEGKAIEDQWIFFGAKFSIMATKIEIALQIILRVLNSWICI